MSNNAEAFPDHKLEKQKALLRAKVLKASSFATCITVSLVVFTRTVTAPMEPGAFIGVLVYLLLNVALLVGIFRNSLSSIVGTYLFFVLMYFAVTVLSLSVRGFLTPAVSVLVFLPMLGSFLLGNRGLVTFGLLSLISLASIFALDINGAISTQPYTSREHGLIAKFAFYFFLTVGSCGISYAFESGRDLVDSNLDKLNKRLREEKSKVEEALEAKSLFLANMSHEVRTPMNGILGLLSLVDKSRLSEDDVRQLAAGEKSGEVLLSLIDDILVFSKSGSDELIFHDETISLKRFFQDIVSVTASKALDFETAVELDCKGLELPLIKADRQRLMQVFINIVSNAIKFSGKSGVLIRIMSRRHSDHQQELLVEVRDRGIGMTEEQLSQLFIPFHQIDNSSTRRFGGVGVGLALCKKLLEKMHGTIEVDSHLGRGTTVTVSLITERCEQIVVEPNKPTVPSEANLSSDDFSHLKVLVAEDNQLNQQVIKKFLEKFHINPKIVGNGQIAVDAVQVDHFHLILMDCHMPEMDGWDATKAIRQLNISQPFISALTASVLEDERQRCVASGMEHFLAKPLKKAQLRELLLLVEKRLAEEENEKAV